MTIKLTNTKGYREMSLSKGLGYNLFDVVDILLRYDKAQQKVCIEYNGVKLYSDTVTFEDAYQEVLGVSFEEFRHLYEPYIYFYR